MIKNEYYYCEYYGGPIIFFYNDILKCYHVMNNQFTKSGWAFWNHVGTKNLRVATIDEREWLKECIKQNKYVAKSSVKYKIIHEVW